MAPNLAPKVGCTLGCVTPQSPPNIGTGPGCRAWGPQDVANLFLDVAGGPQWPQEGDDFATAFENRMGLSVTNDYHTDRVGRNAAGQNLLFIEVDR